MNALEAVPEVIDEPATERVELPHANPTPLEAAFWRLGMRSVPERRRVTDEDFANEWRIK